MTYAIVRLGEVHITGYDVPEMQELLRSKHFGHAVSQLVCSCYRLEGDESLFHMFSQKMMSDVDGLGALESRGICRDFDR